MLRPKYKGLIKFLKGSSARGFIKFLKGSSTVKLCDPGLGNSFLNMTLKA